MQEVIFIYLNFIISFILLFKIILKEYLFLTFLIPLIWKKCCNEKTVLSATYDWEQCL